MSPGFSAVKVEKLFAELRRLLSGFNEDLDKTVINRPFSDRNKNWAVVDIRFVAYKQEGIFAFVLVFELPGSVNE